jgi:uncharacterized protein
MKFELYKDTHDEWRWRLVADNGEIVAQSEGYTRKSNCQKSIRMIKLHAKNARVQEIP